MPLRFTHAINRNDLGIGLVHAEPVWVGDAPLALTRALDEIETQRGGALGAADDARRKASRDVLRNGRYKPTGRGKPANEYLLRAAMQGELPRINGPVDANNLVSLKWMVPISVWDLDLAGGDEVEFRLGRDEQYVFNGAGQSLELTDLVCGCVIEAGGKSRPIVTPIKDGMATKIRPETTRLAAAVYYPLTVGGGDELAAITAELAHWLGHCGVEAAVRHGQLLPGSELTL